MVDCLVRLFLDDEPILDVDNISITQSRDSIYSPINISCGIQNIIADKNILYQLQQGKLFNMTIVCLDNKHGFSQNFATNCILVEWSSIGFNNQNVVKLDNVKIHCCKFN